MGRGRYTRAEGGIVEGKGFGSVFKFRVSGFGSEWRNRYYQICILTSLSRVCTCELQALIILRIDSTWHIDDDICPLNLRLVRSKDYWWFGSKLDLKV